MMGPSYLDPLVVDGLHDPRLRGDPLTLRDTDLKESDDDRGETICPVPSAPLGRTRKRDLLLEEQCFVSRIRLHVLLERFILHQRVIRPEG